MRRTRHYLMALILTALLASAYCPAAAAEETPATAAHHQVRETFAKDFAQTVINILHDHKKSYGDRKDILRRAFSDSVDLDWIAKFTLGRAWRDATEAQREQYISLYHKFLTETYVTQFAENPGNSIYNIRILGVDDDTVDAFSVRTRMELMNQQVLNVSYRVHDEEGSYKVRDITIENVSLIATHRAEFSELAAAKGIDGVIKTLEARVEQLKEITLSMK